MRPREMVETTTNGSPRAPASRNAASPPGEFTSDSHASRPAGDENGRCHREQIDLIIVASISRHAVSEHRLLVSKKIGARRVRPLTSRRVFRFIYALEIGQQFIMSRAYEPSWSSARKTFFHHELDRPQHLRPVWRRRGAPFCSTGPPRTDC